MWFNLRLEKINFRQPTTRLVHWTRHTSLQGGVATTRLIFSPNRHPIARPRGRDMGCIMTVIEWKHFPRYSLCVGNHRSPVDSPHKGQWHGALMFALICTWTNSWANNRDAGDLRGHRSHYDVTVMDVFLWVQSLLYVQLQLLHCCIQWQRVLLDRVITSISNIYIVMHITATPDNGFGLLT